jgi:hypothetical protein
LHIINYDQVYYVSLVVSSLLYTCLRTSDDSCLGDSFEKTLKIK